MPTFAIANVKPTGRAPHAVDEPVSYLKGLKAVTKNNGAVIKFTSPDNAVVPDFRDGFVGAAYMAYNNHHELVIRPDDIWLAILASFAGYVDAHAEEMRDAFVSHAGKERIKVDARGTMHAVDWAVVIREFASEIGKKTRGDVANWAEPNFTTTTDKDRLVGRVMLMGAMKNYFEYRASCCACGLPAVTLQGSLDDWIDIRLRIKRLRSYDHPDLDAWHDVLDHVLDKFISTYQGNVDREWWNQICDYNAMSGSNDVTGWILAFIPFKKGNYRLRSLNDILKNGYYGRVDVGDVESATCVEVPVVIDNMGVELESVFCAGSIFSTYDSSANRVAPAWDWVMIHKDAVNPPDWARPVVDAPLPALAFDYPAIHAHQLSYTEGLRGHRCDTCRSTGLVASFRCKQCDFDMCVRCFRAFYAARNPDVGAEQRTLCAHDHPLTRVHGIKGRFKCNTCAKDQLQSSFRCVACDFDMCVECVDLNRARDPLVPM